jgi:peroxiredoxin
MALTPSTMIQPLGAEAPPFFLPDVETGSTVSLENFAGKKALVVVFLSAQCPFVRHVAPELTRLGRDYQSHGAGIVAIASNDADNHPGDAPDQLAAFANDQGFPFPILYDDTQKTAKDYGAACTPDFFLYDSAGRLVYRGQLDDSRPGNDRPLSGADLRSALDAALAGQPVSAEQRPSIGCNIKWKPGNEPVYHGVQPAA